MMTVFLLGGILGSQFAPMPQLATLPVSPTVVGLAATAIPAALLMERIGRRNAIGWRRSTWRPWCRSRCSRRHWSPGRVNGRRIPARNG